MADRGIGIPQAQRVTVFTPFTRADGSQNYHGTGLGLAIVHRIVERHGGEVGVEANPGGGSRFWFTLPAPVPAPGAAPGLVPGAGAGMAPGSTPGLVPGAGAGSAPGLAPAPDLGPVAAPGRADAG